ncbi:MAG: peptide deformylase [Rikenellaceae bacterium]
MILPICVYGNSILKEECGDIEPGYAGLSELIDNMFETMYKADGIGLAAPQVGFDISLFVIDITGFYEDEESLADIGEGCAAAPFKRVFINPEILEVSEDEEPYNEGCLSLPGINENVMRPRAIVMRYMDENFVEHTEHFDAMWARVIQHEYDHLCGMVFTDRLALIRRQMVRSKLQGIARGVYRASYRCK